MNAYEVKNLIENLFTENGEYIIYDFNDEVLDAPQELKPILEKIEPIFSYQDDSKEYHIQDIAEELCKRAGCQLSKFEIDEAFDSPGLDIYVLSFIIIGDKNEQIVSFHNFYERG
jgi:hypothetical protein